MINDKRLSAGLNSATNYHVYNDNTIFNDHIFLKIVILSLSIQVGGRGWAQALSGGFKTHYKTSN